MNIVILGHGNVGGALAEHLLALGEEVTIGIPNDRSDTTEAVRQRLDGLRSEPFGTAVTNADLVILAVPFAALDDTLPPLRDALAGKIVIDATNPVAPGLTHALASQRSGAEAVAELVPESRVVKAFSIYGAENLAGPPAVEGGIRPVMMIAGDDVAAKNTVAELVERMGWMPLDAGGLVAALQLEHLTLLWVRMVRVDRARPPHLTWAALTSTAD